MAILINGNGNKAIWAAQDADLIASICGNVTAIAEVGNEFVYTQEDANTIGVSDGVIITKEGRRIQLDTGDTDLYTIPTGTLGNTSYYIIGYHLVQKADSSQVCETFVQKMDNATDVIVENTFKGGATEVYVSLYRVTQDGMNIDSVDLLLPTLRNVTQLDNDLEELKKGGIMPNLDYANPLHNFSQSSQYTANQECYLSGFIGVGTAMGTPLTIKINNTNIFGTASAGLGGFLNYKLNSGDTVVCSSLVSNVWIFGLKQS